MAALEHDLLPQRSRCGEEDSYDRDDLKTLPGR